jgi:DivIVA domain-containing protein
LRCALEAKPRIECLSVALTAFLPIVFPIAIVPSACFWICTLPGSTLLYVGEASQGACTTDERGAYSQAVADELRGGSEPESSEAAGAKADLRPARGRTFLPDVTTVEFSSSRRGYDRTEVDQYVERVSRIVVELEAMRSPDAVIERALADVGEETSAILRRARKAAEEIIADAEGHAGDLATKAEAEARALREDADRYGARVKAEAEHVLSDARGQTEDIAAQAAAEAHRVREDADRYRDEVSSHIDQLARERHRLIEDLRQLADQFHRTADRALEQIPGEDVSYRKIEGNGGAAPAEAKSA